MRHKILLTSCAISLILSAAAQKKQTLAFAITSAEKNTFQWTDVKLVDVNTGALVRTIFDSKQPPTAYKVFHARSGQQITVGDQQNVVRDPNSLPFNTMSAALAYDKKHNRLYYTPLYINQLRYIDLNSKELRVFYFDNEVLSSAGKIQDEANHITRMVIASDGNGYGVSNDGNHLVKFTTGKKPLISDLGKITDDAENTVSIHDRKTSWGGDMVADHSGNLYILSAYHHVFKVNIKSRSAAYLGKIEGLPGNFTTNGAVVDNDGNLVVSSANSGDNYFKVDMSNWTATKLDAANKVFNASDLANGNLAFEPKMEAIPKLMERKSINLENIRVFPNPVPASTAKFKVVFNNKRFERYEIQVVDLAGRLLSSKTFVLGAAGQIAEIDLKSTLATGTYIVKVLNNAKKTIYSDKLILE